MIKLDHLLCLDFEASGLKQDSFPVEVALAYPATGKLYETLIRPTEDWLQNGQWSTRAARVHNIARDELLTNGISVRRAAAELNRRARGKIVLSDAPGADRFWLDRLYSAVGTKPPFLIMSFNDFAVDLCLRMRRSPIAYSQYEIESQTRFPITHRAGADARSRAETLRLIAGHNSREVV